MGKTNKQTHKVQIRSPLSILPGSDFIFLKVITRMGFNPSAHVHLLPIWSGVHTAVPSAFCIPSTLLFHIFRVGLGLS